MHKHKLRITTPPLYELAGWLGSHLFSGILFLPSSLLSSFSSPHIILMYWLQDCLYTEWKWKEVLANKGEKNNKTLVLAVSNEPINFYIFCSVHIRKSPHRACLVVFLEFFVWCSPQLTLSDRTYHNIHSYLAARLFHVMQKWSQRGINCEYRRLADKKWDLVHDEISPRWACNSIILGDCTQWKESVVKTPRVVFLKAR